MPLIDIWLLKFKQELESKFTSLTTQDSQFTFLPTYDIDIAWSYKNKGFVRSVAASLNRPSSIVKRIKVIAGKEKDPYDSYDWLKQLHEENNLQPIYFFLVAAENSEYDKNISPKKKALHQLIQSTATHAIIALNPSTQINTNTWCEKWCIEKAV